MEWNEIESPLFIKSNSVGGCLVSTDLAACRLNLSVKGCKEPREPFGEARARSGTSRVNGSVWWSWVWVEAVACGPQNLTSLVKGEVRMQKACQLDRTGLPPPRGGSSGGSQGGREPAWSSVRPRPQDIIRMLFIIFDTAVYGTWMSGPPAGTREEQGNHFK